MVQKKSSLQEKIKGKIFMQVNILDSWEMFNIISTIKKYLFLDLDE